MQRDRWQAGLLAREALRNTLALRARLYPLVVLAVLFGVAAPLYAAWEAQQFTQQLNHETAAGRNLLAITTLDQNNPARITVRSCNALTNDNDVAAAGAIEPVGTENFFQLGTSITVLAASPTLLPDLERHTVLVGPDLTRASGSFPLRMPEGNVLDAARGLTEPDQLGTNSAVVIALPASATTTTTCLVKLAPAADPRTSGNRLLAELDHSGGPMSSTEQFTEPQNPIEIFLSRPGQFLPTLLGLAGGLVTGILNRLRTGEWASYRMSGTSPRSLRTLLFYEEAIVAGILVATSTLTVAVLHARLVSPTSIVLAGVGAAAAWVAVATLLTIDLPRRKPTSLAKDR